MKESGRRRTHTFSERQKALLLALLMVTLLDLVVSIISMREISSETAVQMQRTAGLHMQQVYEDYSKVSFDMRRILMENQDLTGLVQQGNERERIYAKNKLIDKINYSFGSGEDFQVFFYFGRTKDTFAASWLKMQNDKEDGIVETVLDKIREDEELTVDLYHWDYFLHGETYYMLRAYQYNDVWFICYVPAGRIIKSLEQVYATEDTHVLLLSGDGELLSGQQTAEEWDIPLSILQNGGSIYRFPFARYQAVQEKSSMLDFSITVVTKGFGGFSRIVAIQALVFFMVLLTLLAFVLMNLYTKWRIIAPVQKFAEGLMGYRGGDADGQELSVSDFHELEQVNEQFRNFVHQIGALKINVYEEKIQRQKMETDNLKLQLKPHFFLNTIGMIYSLLDAGRVEGGKQMCQASIRYLRYLFRADMEEVCVREAISHAEDYMEIMKLRYPHEVEADIYMEEAVKECKMPPLVIQTLVENAIKYGKRSDRILEISITVTMELYQGKNMLCINVSDNGKGFLEEYLRIWEQGKDLEQSQGQHIGIANIRARLLYAYGGRAFVKFYNSPLGGAAAELYLPTEDEEETDEYSAGG